MRVINLLIGDLPPHTRNSGEETTAETPIVWWDTVRAKIYCKLLCFEQAGTCVWMFLDMLTTAPARCFHIILPREQILILLPLIFLDTRLTRIANKNIIDPIWLFLSSVLLHKIFLMFCQSLVFKSFVEPLSHLYKFSIEDPPVTRKLNSPALSANLNLYGKL